MDAKKGSVHNDRLDQFSCPWTTFADPLRCVLLRAQLSLACSLARQPVALSDDVV